MKKNKFELKSHIFRHGGLYCIALLALLFSVSLSMISPQITRMLVDDVIIGGETQKLKILLLALLGIGVGRMIFQYTKEYLFDWLSATISSQLRKDLFVHILNLDTSFFDKTNTGEVMARLKDDIDKVWSALSFITMLLIEVTVHTLCILYCMFKLNAKIATVPLIAIVFCGCLAIFLEKKLDKIYGDISEKNAEMNTTAEENIAGVRTVKAFAREPYEIKKFYEKNAAYCELNVKQEKMFVKYYPYFSFIGKIVPLIVILLGGYGYYKNPEVVTIGTITAFIQYSGNIVWPMEMLGWLTNEFSSAIASVKKINGVYEETATISDPENPVILPNVQGDIEFSHVGFHKEDGHEIISDVSFKIEKGKTLGIMGTTGAGKTSIISLLTRLYDVTSGEIKLDGVNIKDLSIDQLRGNISLVMQDVFLFSDTIKENVIMGKRKLINDAIVKRSCQYAGATEFIEKMDQKYDTVIGERGVGLSGGQKQRISIARAFAKELPILVMDDSTSALDMETERDIQRKLKDLKNMTKIIIAHRISSVKDADEIIVLDGGKIAERGTHAELLKEKGLYYETYVSQFGIPSEKEVI